MKLYQKYGDWALFWTFFLCKWSFSKQCDQSSFVYEQPRLFSPNPLIWYQIEPLRSLFPRRPFTYLIILHDTLIWNTDDTFQRHIDKYTFYPSSQDSSSSSPWAKEQNFWVIGCNHKKVGIESKNEQHCSIVQMITAQFWSHRSEAA